MLDDVIIRTAVGDEGLITIQPSGIKARQWKFWGDRPTVQDLIFDDNGYGMTDAALLAWGGPSDGTVLRCDFIGFPAKVLDINNTSGWEIGECSFDDGVTLSSAAIVQTGATGMDVYDCEFYAVSSFAGTSGGGNTWERCVFRYSAGTVADGDVFKNCIVKEMNASGVAIGAGVTTAEIYNCTFYDVNVSGISVAPLAYASAIYNCTFMDCNYGINGSIAHGSTPAPENCHFYNCTSADIDDYPACISPQSGDPLFLDPVAGNFIFATGSPLQDNGKSLPGVVDEDFAGTARPQGPNWDIGAFEVAAVPGRIVLSGRGIPSTATIDLIDAGDQTVHSMPNGGAGIDDLSTSALMLWSGTDGAFVSASEFTSPAPPVPFWSGFDGHLLYIYGCESGARGWHRIRVLSPTNLQVTPDIEEDQFSGSWVWYLFDENLDEDYIPDPFNCAGRILNITVSGAVPSLVSGHSYYVRVTVGSNVITYTGDTWDEP